MASQPLSQPTRTATATAQPPPRSSTATKVDVSVHPSSHLDPGAYVRGTYPITIGQNVLVHPRVYLLSIYSPLVIGDGCIIGERSVLGGPAPAPAPASGPSIAASDQPESAGNADNVQGEVTRATIIENAVHVHANAMIKHGATIRSYSIIESNTVVDSDVIVGRHSKISANLTVKNDVPDWTVLWGSDNDQRRRTRKTKYQDTSPDTGDLTEQERLKAFEKERDGTIGLLKAAAAKQLASGSSRKK